MDSNENRSYPFDEYLGEKEIIKNGRFTRHGNDRSNWLQLGPRASWNGFQHDTEQSRTTGSFNQFNFPAISLYIEKFQLVKLTSNEDFNPHIKIGSYS